MHGFDSGDITVFDWMMEYASDGELFDQVLKESEEETLMHEVTSKLRFHQICLSYIDGESFDEVVKESEKAIMMSEVNVKLSPKGAFTSN